MRLSHSISMTLFVSLAALVSACSDEASDDGGTGGTSGSSTGGTATGGTATGGSGGAGGSGFNDRPADLSQAAIEAYLAMNTYTMTGMGWRPETMASAGTMAPHHANKRYFNETLIASKAAMNSGSTHTPGSMAVKDILEGTAVVGKAAMLRGDGMWAYYCMSSIAGRCFSNSPANMAYYSTTSGSCACHGSGTIISSDVIPAP